MNPGSVAAIGGIAFLWALAIFLVRRGLQPDRLQATIEAQRTYDRRARDWTSDPADLEQTIRGVTFLVSMLVTVGAVVAVILVLAS